MARLVVLLIVVLAFLGSASPAEKMAVFALLACLAAWQHFREPKRTGPPKT
jgi:hypothetical protein